MDAGEDFQQRRLAVPLLPTSAARRPNGRVIVTSRNSTRVP